MFWILAALAIGALIYYKIVRPSCYWKNHKITYAPSWPLVGNMLEFVLRKKHISEVLVNIYQQFPLNRYVGYEQFLTPILMLRDLELIKRIGIKDFEHFQDHMTFAVSERDPLLKNNLMNLTGEEWKQMRSTLSPAFTSSKMKKMYPLMWKCSETFVKYFEDNGGMEVEMKDICTRFSNDVIASMAFGIQVDSMREPNNQFYEMGKALTTFTPLKTLKILLIQSSTILAQMLNIRLLDKNVGNFFRDIVISNIRKREQEHIVRYDLIHLLMKARKGQLKHDDSSNSDAGFATTEESEFGKSSKQLELTENHIIAQAIIFFFGGFDTVSTASTFMACELAVNPGIQIELQREIDLVCKNSQEHVSYEDLLSMKYLDQVVSETLRLWPPGFQAERICTRDYTIEPKEFYESNALHIKKGTVVVVPTVALHRDPQYFSHPHKFDPDRFSDKNRSKIVPGTYLPFGVGPRNCIGSRFALLEMKVLFFNLLSKFDIVLTENTKVPLKIGCSSPTLAPAGKVILKLKLRDT